MSELKARDKEGAKKTKQWLLYKKRAVKNSLKRRLMRAFRTLNLLSLTLMFAMIIFLMSIGFNALTGLISESVASQMANALSLHPDMPYDSLGEPYRLTALPEDLPEDRPAGMPSPPNETFYLIQYMIVKDNQVVYESISRDQQRPPRKEELQSRSLLNYISVPSTQRITNATGQTVGSVRVDVNPILLYIAFTGLFVSLVIGSIFVLIISQIGMRVFGPVVIKPLNELEKRMGDMANGDLHAALQSEMMFKKPVLEVMQLSEHANKIMHRMHDYIVDLEKQQNAVKDQMAKIQAIFQKIDQGIFQIDESLRIQPAYSLECEKIVGRQLGHLTIGEVLFPESHQEGERIFFVELLDKIFKTKGMEQEVFLSLLPDFLELNGRWLNIDYKLSYDGSQPMLMIVMSDLTEKRQMEAQMQQEQSMLKMVVKAMIQSEEVGHLLRAYEAFSENAMELFMQKEWSFLIREIHTFKGSFSQYDWTHLVAALNQMENDLMSSPESISSAQFSQDALLSLAAKDLEVIRMHAGEEFLKVSTVCLVDKDKILKVEDRVKELLSREESREILPLIRELRYVSIKKILNQYSTYVQKLSERLEKEINPLKITGVEALVDPDYYSEVFRTFVHLFRNSVDHGIESAEERMAAGKTLAGNLEIQVKDLGAAFEVIFLDDGKGIDLERLAEKARQKNIDYGQLKDLAFVDGLSSKEEATLISGKGYGLAALKSAVEALGGHISVDTELGRGTRFKIQLPKPMDVNDLTSPEEFIKGVDDSVQALIVQKYGVIITSNEVRIDNHIELDEMTAIINLKGTMNLIILLSVNRSMLHRLSNHMIFYDLNDENLSEIEEDLLGELANTLIGNSLKDFDHREDIFHLGIPVIMSHSEGYVKYSQDMITSRFYEFETNRLSIHLIPIHSEYIIKRVEEI